MTEQEPFVRCEHLYRILSPANEEAATATVWQRHGVWWLTNVWTHHEYRQRGYATRCVKTAIADHSHHDLYLHVSGYVDQPLRDEQLAAWYAKFGFEPIDTLGTMRRKASG
jgi:GNAT superfamily N-acetyltransferase